MDQFVVVFVTCGSEEESSKIAHALVDERLAACVNVVSPVRSVYRWEGKLWDEKEWLLIIKSRENLFQDLEKRVKSLHSYQVPEIIGLPVLAGSRSYLNWLGENTENEGQSVN
jgi:periplasmic divalent cation tolerance protein